MPRLPEGPDENLKHLYNPLTEDYTTTYANSENIPIPYTCHAQEISTFPTYIANKIAKNLASYIVLKRGVKTNYADELEAVLQEITVKV